MPFKASFRLLRDGRLSALLGATAELKSFYKLTYVFRGFGCGSLNGATTSSSLKVRVSLGVVSFANVSTSFHTRDRAIQSGRRDRWRSGAASPRD